MRFVLRNSLFTAITALALAGTGGFTIHIPQAMASGINGTHRCTNGSRITVSGYKDWMSGALIVNWKGKNYRLKNYYKDAWGNSPDSSNGYMDTGAEFKLVISGKTVCAIR
jgi:hypothetical protein